MPELESPVDVQSWMSQLMNEKAARWFTLDRLLPAYHDAIAATGFMEDLEGPTDEPTILQKWGGGQYRITAKAVGKGRGAKRVIDTFMLDLAGPPRAYPGPDKNPVAFPSAKPFEVNEDDGDMGGGMDDFEGPDPHRREVRERIGRPFPGDRGDRFDPRPPLGDRENRFERDMRGYPPRPPFRGPGFSPEFDMPRPSLSEGASPADLVKERMARRAEAANDTSAMRILKEANGESQAALTRQLETMVSDNQALRNALLEREDRANKPYEEGMQAMKARMEEQRQDFAAQTAALRGSYDQQITSLRSNYDQQLTTLRLNHEQQVAVLNQRHEAERRSLLDQRESEVKSLQRQIDVTREDMNQRLRDAEAATRNRVEDAVRMLTTSFETRIALLTSERDSAQRRCDEMFQRTSSEVAARVGDERRSSETNTTLLKTMLESREASTKQALENEVARLKDELTNARTELAEARKAAEPQVALGKVAAMAGQMRELGMVGPVTAAKEEEAAVPDDPMSRFAATATKLMAAAEPVLSRADGARRDVLRLREQEIQGRLAATQIAAQTRLALAGQRPMTPPPQLPQPTVPATQNAPAVNPTVDVHADVTPLRDLLVQLEQAMSGGMTPDQVAGLVKMQQGSMSADAQQMFEALIERPSDEVASELSTAAETLGMTTLATPRGTRWLQGLHEAILQDETP
jgi:hypothetical protein